MDWEVLEVCFIAHVFISEIEQKIILNHFYAEITLNF